MSSPGDWTCGACQHINFKKRESCQKCNFPKYRTKADIPTYLYMTNNRTEVLAGDWYCQDINCGAHNYASRTSCFRCGNIKSNYGTAGYATVGGDKMILMGNSGEYCSQQQLLPPGWKAGDWMCSRQGCGLHNYACRMECYKCRTPRDFGSAM